MKLVILDKTTSFQSINNKLTLRILFEKLYKKVNRILNLLIRDCHFSVSFNQFFDVCFI